MKAQKTIVYHINKKQQLLKCIIIIINTNI